MEYAGTIKVMSILGMKYAGVIKVMKCAGAILGNEGYLCREVAVRVKTQHMLNDTSHK